jgi:hypothetical protein
MYVNQILWNFLHTLHLLHVAITPLAQSRWWRLNEDNTHKVTHFAVSSARIGFAVANSTQEIAMTPKLLAVCSLALGTLLAVAPVAAHHSFAAEYDNTKPFKLTGAVTKIDWTNPHVYFFIDVKDAATGRVTNWAFEMAAPAALKNTGWKKDSMKHGDIVTVEGSLAKDGGNHGNARSVVLTSTGQRLGAASSEYQGK